MFRPGRLIALSGSYTPRPPLPSAYAAQWTRSYGPWSHMAHSQQLTHPSLAQVQHYLRLFTQAQLNAFATHAARYLEIYLPSAVIEIAQTDRYSHRTGKAELCILATRSLPVGSVIAELKGSMAVLTEEENEDLKRTDRRSSQGARRDFSVIHSGHRKKNHLFLGPARFVNVRHLIISQGSFAHYILNG
jgi:histone-lysine N-methyltransferase SUV420H